MIRSARNADTSREVTGDEALQHKTCQDVIAGNRAARRQVLKMIVKREIAITERAPPVRPVEVKVEPEDPTNANEARLILGIACQDPRWVDEQSGKYKRLLIEPWAVKAALHEKSG